MIIYFTGTGNSEYTAKRIAAAVSDECLNLFERIKKHDYADLYSEKPWVVVYPTYAWRMPAILENYLKMVTMKGCSDIYFVATCGGSIGNMQKYVKAFAEEKQLIYKGCAEVVMPENYLAMFKVPDEAEAVAIIKKADRVIDALCHTIQENKEFPKKKVNVLDHVLSGTINKGFNKRYLKRDKFYIRKGCISCGKCAAVCPTNNIQMVNGSPVWLDACTQCMACITLCPQSVIEYGKKTVGKSRYRLPLSVLEK